MYNDNLKTLLKDTQKTSDIIDLIQKRIKEESIKVYDELYKDFKGGITERKRLNLIATERIEILSFDIRNKYFNTL
jgi:hypothetical protein